MSDVYDAGLLSDYGGGNVEWWQDYIRAELGHAHQFYAAQIDASRAREAKLVEALRTAHGALALVHRGLVAGHVKAKAVIPREGPITSLEERVAQAMLAIAPHLSPYTPAEMTGQ